MRRFAIVATLMLGFTTVAGCRVLVDTVVDGFTESLFGKDDDDHPFRGTEMPERYKDRFREQKRQNDFLREH